MPARLPLELIERIARKNGGILLTTTYPKSLNPSLRFQCSLGHVWETRAVVINAGGWCPKCSASRNRLTIQDMHDTAKKKGGFCLSAEYKGAKTKLKWKCKIGHTWLARPSCIRSRNWCPACARRIPLTIEQMKDLARSHGGKCLSRKYINTDTKLKWRCKNDHIFFATPQSVKNEKRWCLRCSGHARYTIEMMQEIAKSRGGRLLSKQIPNSPSKALRWICKKGHKWIAEAKGVKHGSWCRKCADDYTSDILRNPIEHLQQIAKSKGGELLTKK